MTLQADTNRVIELAETYIEGPPAGIEHATLEDFFQAVSALIDEHPLARILGCVSEQDVEDGVKTFVERTVLSDVARRPNPSLECRRLLFACLDYESLVFLSKNPTVDELNQSRAKFEALRIKQAYLSQFE